MIQETVLTVQKLNDPPAIIAQSNVSISLSILSLSLHLISLSLSPLYLSIYILLFALSDEDLKNGLRCSASQLQVTRVALPYAVTRHEGFPAASESYKLGFLQVKDWPNPHGRIAEKHDLPLKRHPSPHPWNPRR